MNQPSPVQNDMTLRNVPIPGVSEDTGGNPQGEGILASNNARPALEIDPVGSDLSELEASDFAFCPKCGVNLSEVPEPIAHLEEHLIPQPGSQDELGAGNDEVGGNSNMEGQIGEGWKPGTSAEGGRDEYASVKKKWSSKMKISEAFDQYPVEQLTPQMLESAKAWINDSIGDMPLDATEEEIINFIEQNFEGGLPGFIKMEQEINQMTLPEDDPGQYDINPYSVGGEAYPSISENRPLSKLLDYQSNTKIATPYDMGDIDVADFEVTQVIPEGPHTIEIDRDGEDTPLVLQHDNPDVLDQAKDKLSATKTSQLQALLALPEMMGGGEAAAGLGSDGISKSLMGGLTQGAISAGSNPVSGALFGSPSSYESHIAEETPAEQEVDSEISDNGGDEGISELLPFDSELVQAFSKALPALLHFYNSEESGKDHPDIAGFIAVAEAQAPDLLSLSPSEDELKEIQEVLTDNRPTSIEASLRTAMEPPAAEMSYGDPSKYQEIPLPDYINDPVYEGFIQLTDQLLATYPNLAPQAAVVDAAQKYNINPDVAQQVYDTSLAKDWQGIHRNYPDTPPRGYEDLIAPTFPSEVGQLPPSFSNSWTEEESGSFNSPLTIEKWIGTGAEEIDPHEKDYNDTSTWQKSFLTGEAEGGGSFSPFPVDSEAGMNNMNDTPAPTEQHDNPAPNNPDIARQVAILRHRDRALQRGASYPEEVPAPVNTVFPSVNQLQNPDSQAICPHCGIKYDGGMTCPQCNQQNIGGFGQPPQQNPSQALEQQQNNQIIQKGMENRQQVAKVAGQGPHDIQQIAMVYQYLLESGRGDEASNLIEHPEQYAQELANVQRKGTLPGVDESELAPPMPAPMPQQGPQPQGPEHPMQPPMTASRIAADSAAPRCPKCGSGTTRVESNEGDCYCHACHHRYNSKPLFKDEIRSTSAISPVWETNAGMPLEEGRLYEMYSKESTVPDIVRIDQLSPGQIVYTMTGLYGQTHQGMATQEKAQSDGIMFASVDHSTLPVTLPDKPAEPSHEDNPTPFEGWPEQDTMSVQSVKKEAAPPPAFLYEQTDIPPGETLQQYQQGARDAVCMNCHRPMQVHGDESPECAMCKQQAAQAMTPQYAAKTAGAQYTLAEQRDLINERGHARNLVPVSEGGMMDLSNTHYIDDDEFLFGM